MILRSLWLCAAVLVAALCVPGVGVHAATPTPVATPVASPQQTLLAAINADRAAHHVPPLTLDLQESKCSKKHSRHMAGIGMLAHDEFPTDICVAHTFAAENIGMASGSPATTVLLLHREMMAEGPCPHRTCPGKEYPGHGHYVNLVNPAYTRVGIGIYASGGTTWLTEDFTG